MRQRESGLVLVAEAYRGSYIRQATEDFLAAAAGERWEALTVSFGGKSTDVYLGGGSALVTYIGRNGPMDFQLTSIPRKRDQEKREAIILACASTSYFADALRATGANPLLWTTNLMRRKPTSFQPQ